MCKLFSAMHQINLQFRWKSFNMDEFKESLKTRPKSFTGLFSRRPKQVAWLVSHCDTHSQREAYAKELKKHIQVDIYGACGMQCGRKDCFDNIAVSKKIR